MAKAGRGRRVRGPRRDPGGGCAAECAVDLKNGLLEVLVDASLAQDLTSPCGGHDHGHQQGHLPHARREDLHDTAEGKMMIIIITVTKTGGSS